MADRPFIKPDVYTPLVNAASTATTVTSAASSINKLSGISYDLTWTGTTTGTFAVQVSNSYSINCEGAVINAGSWNTLPTASFTGTYPVPAGSPGNGFLDVVGTEAAWVRLVFTPSAGTGTLTVLAAAKVI